MLCLSGFELYSRWVPLILGDLCGFIVTYINAGISDLTNRDQWKVTCKRNLSGSGSLNSFTIRGILQNVKDPQTRLLYIMLLLPH